MRFHDSRGFTLIELIVALTVMGLVMTVAFAGFRTGLNAWEKGAKVAERLERRSVVERLIRRQLPLAMRGNDFQGTSDRIEFVADYSLADGAGDFYRIEYAVDKGRFLYSDISTADDSEEKPSRTPPTALAELKHISFSYLGRNAEGVAWVDEWETGKPIPPAVRVRLDDDTFVIQMVNR